MVKPAPTIEELRASVPAPSTVKAPDRKDRLDFTMRPDARKSRDMVRRQHWHSLVELAEALVPVIGDPILKQRLDNTSEAYRAAARTFALQTGRNENDIISWVGGDPNGYVCVPPEPEHYVDLARTWLDMLAAVNEATGVGVQKKNRYASVCLIADPDDAAQRGTL